MHRSARSLLAAITLALTASAVFAQTAATLVGDIFDPSGNIIPNASVTVTSTGTGAARTVQTNSAGQYRITPLNPGSYSLQVKADGFKSQVRKDIDLPVSAVLEVDFNLAHVRTRQQHDGDCAGQLTDGRAEWGIEWLRSWISLFELTRNYVNFP